MELDDLKASWQRETEMNLEINKQSMEQLKLMLQEKSSGTLTGMKKKYEKIISLLMVGILLNVLVNPFLHFLLGDEGPVFRITLGGLLLLVTVVVFGLIVIFFYWLKYTTLKTVISASNLKESLTENIARFKKYLKQEISFILALFGALFICGRLSSEYLGNGKFWDIWHQDIVLAMLAAGSIMGFYIYKRARAYKKNIRELQQYLAEFDEGSNK
ncbi:MAG: hypothetical protein JWQ14_2114 [Adhaeribacter sp.]|nr:hypothetical protein [Adhaeribacter sp.]